MIRRYTILALLFLITPNCFPQSSTDTIRLLVEHEGKWGYVDENSVVQIPFLFSHANPFENNGLAKVRKDGEHLIITKNNLTLLKGKYHNLQQLKGNYYKYQVDSSWGILVLYKNLKSKHSYREPYNYFKNHPLFLVETSNGFGVLDSNLKEIIPTKFNEVWQEGSFILVKEGAYVGAFNFAGERITQTKWDSLKPVSNKHLVAFKNDQTFLVQNTKLKPRKVPKGDYFSLNDHFFAVSVNQQMQIIRFRDLKSKPLKANHVSPIKGLEKSFKFNDGDWFGLFNYDQGIIIPADKEDIFEDQGFLFVRENGKLSFYNSSGDKLSNYPFDACLNFRNGLAFIRNNSEYGVVDSNTKLLIDIKYRSITLLESQIRAFTPDSKLHLYELTNGKITDKMEFGTVYKLNLDGNTPSSRRVSAPVFSNTNKWFFKSRWGLKDSSNKILIKPIFTGTKKSKLPPFVFTYMSTSKRDKYPFGFGFNPGRSKKGLVNEQTGKIIAFPHFSMIDENDVNDSTRDLVRVRSYAGYYALISKTQKQKGPFWKTTYIGAFKNGLAPVYLKGYMTIKKPEGNPVSIGSVQSVLRSMGLDPYAAKVYRYTRNKRIPVYLTGGYWNYLTSEGKLLFPMPKKYKPPKVKIEFASEFDRGLAKIRVQNKWSLIDTNGNRVTRSDYAEIRTVHRNNKNYYITYLNAPRHSTFDLNGNLFNEHPLSEINEFNGNHTWVKRGAQLGVMNRQGKIKFTDLEIRRKRPFSEGYAPVKIGRNWVFVDTLFQLFLLKDKAYNLGSFNNGLAYAKVYVDRKNGTKYGYVNKDFEFVIPPQYVKAYNFKNGIAKVRDNKGRFIYINTRGEKITKRKYNRVKDFDNTGKSVVWKGSKSGVIDSNGRQLTPFRNHKPYVAGDHIFTLKSNKLVVYDSKGKKINKKRNIHHIWSTNAKLVKVKQDGFVGYMDHQGNWVLPPVYKYATNFEDGFALAGTRHALRIINEKGDTVSTGYFDRKKGFSNHFIVQKTKANPPRYYYVNNYGVNVFTNSYNYAYDFVDGRAIINLKGKWGVIDTSGLFLIPPLYDHISFKHKTYIKASNHFNYGLLDDEGEVILPAVYESVRFLPENVIMITEKEIPSYMNLNLEWIWNRTSQIKEEKTN